MRKIQDLFSELKTGWVACSSKGEWKWYEKKPTRLYQFGGEYYLVNDEAFYFGTPDYVPDSKWLDDNIEPSKDWEHSLMEVKQASKMKYQSLQLELF